MIVGFDFVPNAVFIPKTPREHRAPTCDRNSDRRRS